MSEFKLVTVADNEPLSNDNFYKWLDTFGKRAIPQNPIVAYLETLGFVVGRDFITEGQHKTLEYVVDTFYRCEPETKREFSVDELFPDNGFFYVKGAEGKRKISQDLRELVISSGWVYGVTPETTFFEITDNRLFAKYQQILGSRFICRLKQYPKVTVYRRGWYDKVNGNTYFSCLVTWEGGEFVIPFQYGYGSQWQYEAREELIKRGLVSNPGFYPNGSRKGSVSDASNVDFIDLGNGLKRNLYK